jgi:hypothetical protein
MNRLNDLYPDQGIHPPTIWAESRLISKEFLLSITGRKEGPSQDQYYLTGDCRGVLVRAWDTGFIITVLRLSPHTVEILTKPTVTLDTEDEGEVPSHSRELLQSKVRDLFQNPNLALRARTSLCERFLTLLEEGAKQSCVGRRWTVHCPTGRYLLFQNLPDTATIHFVADSSRE